jgi:hypothetical protein
MKDLRQKIQDAKQLLPMPYLMRRLGYDEKHIGKTALCPFHHDQHPSFSVFQKNGAWFYRCFVGCSSGDEITFLVKHFGISRREAIKRYLDMAGFPPSRPPKSHEYPQCHKSPKSPVFPVSPVSLVSNGQRLDAEQQRLLESYAERNACTHAGDKAGRKRFKLARDVRAVEKGIGRELSIDELTIVFDNWNWLSQPFLDPAKTRDDYWIAFLAEIQKVRVPTGEGTLTKALERVSKLSLDQLPVIPGYSNAPEKCRRLLALHRELSRLCANGTYFLSYRDAAKACKGFSHQEAHRITGALGRLGVIKALSKGEPGLNSAKAAVFQYLLAETAGTDEDDDEIPV